MEPMSTTQWVITLSLMGFMAIMSWIENEEYNRKHPKKKEGEK